jgi:serine/threonine protein kinase
MVFTHNPTPLVRNLIENLLKRDPEKRIKFPLIIIHNLFKKYPSLPHILP